MSTSLLIITGASSGIGKSTAQFFQKKGWEILNLSRSSCDIPNVKNISIDLSQAGWHLQHQNGIKNFIENLQPEKICLVHNASQYVSDAITNIDAEKFRQVIETNLVTPILLNQIILPYMKSASSIIYIGSTLSEIAVKNAATYSTIKHAIAGLMRATCQDLSGKNIHTCCICPGFTNTQMLRKHVGNNENVINAIKNLVTAKRLIEPLEIASFIFYCANNSVINGSVLHANLGQISN